MNISWSNYRFYGWTNQYSFKTPMGHKGGRMMKGDDLNLFTKTCQKSNSVNTNRIAQQKETFILTSIDYCLTCLISFIAS